MGNASEGSAVHTGEVGAKHCGQLAAQQEITYLLPSLNSNCNMCVDKKGQQVKKSKCKGNYHSCGLTPCDDSC